MNDTTNEVPKPIRFLRQILNNDISTIQIDHNLTTPLQKDDFIIKLLTTNIHIDRKWDDVREIIKQKLRPDEINQAIKYLTHNTPPQIRLFISHIFKLTFISTKYYELLPLIALMPTKPLRNLPPLYRFIPPPPSYNPDEDELKTIIPYIINNIIRNIHDTPQTKHIKKMFPPHDRQNIIQRIFLMQLPEHIFIEAMHTMKYPILRESFEIYKTQKHNIIIKDSEFNTMIKQLSN